MKKRQLIIFGIILVVVIGGAIAAAFYFSQLSSKEAAQNQAKQSTTGFQKPPAEKKADVADKQAFEGNVEAGVKTLDDAIKNTTDKSEQFIYYSRKATLLFNHKSYGEALEAAKKAYDIDHTSDIAAFVGQIALAKGDKVTALEYYKHAVEFIDKEDPFSNEDTAYYQGIIKDLEGKTNG